MLIDKPSEFVGEPCAEVTQRAFLTEFFELLIESAALPDIDAHLRIFVFLGDRQNGRTWIRFRRIRRKIFGGCDILAYRLGFLRGVGFGIAVFVEVDYSKIVDVCYHSLDKKAQAREINGKVGKLVTNIPLAHAVTRVKGTSFFSLLKVLPTCR